MLTNALTARSSTALGGSANYNYSWDFGDSTQAVTSQNPSHTYQNPGTYSVTLVVTDSVSNEVLTNELTVTVQNAKSESSSGRRNRVFNGFTINRQYWQAVI
ncbi:PKD domain-containing protein (plasmid) [Pseudoalteromonas espejiana]